MAELMMTQHALQQNYRTYNITYDQAAALSDALGSLIEKMTGASGKDASSKVTLDEPADPIEQPHKVLDPTTEAHLVTLLAALPPIAWQAIDLVGMAIRPYIVRRPIGEQLLQTTI
jgi:hypothetical protein